MSNTKRYEDDLAAGPWLAANGSMMCEEHPGHEWKACPGGDNCLGPGTPWILRGRTAILEACHVHEVDSE